MRAPVSATQRRILRCVCRVKMVQAAKAGYPGAALSAEPQQNVHIMAAFLQDHWAGLFTAAPVAPHKAVGMVPVAHILNLRQRRNFPHLPIIDQLLDGSVKRRIAQHMAHAQHTLCLLGCRRNGPAFCFAVAHGLFQQHMIPLLQRGQRGFRMHIIQRTYKRGICHLRARHQIFPVAERPVSGDTVSAAHQSAPVRLWFRHGYDPKFFGMLLRITGINLPARACANEDRRHRVHAFPPSSSRCNNSS